MSTSALIPGHHRRLTKPTSFNFRDAVRKAVAEGREFSIHDVQGLPAPVVYAIVREAHPELGEQLHMRLAEKHGGSWQCEGWPYRDRWDT